MRRPITTSLLTCLLLFASLEGMSYLALYVLSTFGISYAPLSASLSDEQRTRLRLRLDEYRTAGTFGSHHPTLGWTVPKANTTQDFTSNSQGIRAKREYTLEPAPDILRISAFGDSFTFGSEVLDRDTWEEQLGRSDPRLEVLNFAVPAYGLDQAYLRYHTEGARFGSDIVVIGFMSENIRRNVNVFRPFYHRLYWSHLFTKPRFVVREAELVLLPNPLSTVSSYERLLTHDREVLAEIGHDDYFYRTHYHPSPFDWLRSVRLARMAWHAASTRWDGIFRADGMYNVHSEAFALTVKIFDAFYREALTHQSLPVILIYPDLGDLDRYHRQAPRRYEPLLDVFKAKGYRHIDVLDAFIQYDRRVKTEDLTVGTWGHLSPLGNKIVADALLKSLQEERRFTRPQIREQARRELTRIQQVMQARS